MGGSPPVVALIATSGVCDFLANSLAALMKCGINSDRVVVGCPSDDYSRVDAVAKQFKVSVEVIHTPSEVQIPGNALEFKSEGFKEVQWLKIRLVRLLLERYERVIYSDLDVAWLRDPSEYLRSVLDCYPMTFQSEAQAVFPPAICAGFMAFRRSDSAITFLDAMLTEDDRQRTNGRRDSDQPVGQRLLESNPHWLRETFLLPESLFPNGLFLSLLHRERTGLTTVWKIDPFIVHVNWLVGSEAKRKALHSIGAWTNPSSYIQSQMATSKVTVLFPMFDLRIDVAQAVRGWTTGQTADKESYRVVVVAGPESSSMVASVRSQLRPADSIVEVHKSGNEVDYWVAGAQATSSPWLLHVEAHTRPDKDCIKQLNDWIDTHPESEALNCTITNSLSHNVSRLMKSWFRDLHSSWADAETWPRLHRTAFAIRRNLFQDSDILQAKYGQFAPALLSARLHSDGRRIITLPEARVQHEDSMMRQHQLDTTDYVCGELQAFKDEPPHLMATYFGSPPADRLRMMDGRLALAQVASLLRPSTRSNIRNLHLQFVALGTLVRRSLASHSSVIPLRRSWSKLMGWAIETIPLPHRFNFRLFVRDHRRVVETEQLAWYLSHGRPNGAVRATDVMLRIQDLEPGSLLGAHDLESHNGTSFRWSEPLFFLRLRIPQGTWVVRLDLASVTSHIQHQQVFATFGGRQVIQIEGREDKLDLTIKSSGGDDQFLMVCVPKRREPGRHARKLGLPLAAISIRSETPPADSLTVSPIFTSF